MRTAAIICSLILGSFLVQAQQSDNRQTYPSVICEYSIPQSRKGLSTTSFLVTPKIYLNRFEKSATIILDISKVQGTATNPNPSFKYSYNYNGRQYGNETLGYEVFNNIVASDIRYEVLVTYGSKSWGWTEVDGKTNHFGPVDKDAKASDINVRVKVVSIGSFSGTAAIDAKIQSLLSAQKTIASSQALPTANTPRAQQTNVQQMERGKINTAATHGAVLQNKLPKEGAVQKNVSGSKENTGNSKAEVQKTASEQLKEQQRESAAAAEREKQALVEQANYAAHQAKVSLERAKEEKRRVNAEVMTKAVGLASEILGDWQASRERKLEREKEEGTRHTEMINRDRLAFNSFVNDRDNQLKGNLNAYLSAAQRTLPSVLAGTSISWEDLIGSPDYNNVFGKDIKAVAKKLKLILPKEKATNGLDLADTKDLSVNFSHNTLYVVSSSQNLFYWVKSDFYEHGQSFIVDENQVLIGIKLRLHTNAYVDKAFPSSMNEYLPMKDYLDDIQKNTKGAYFKADGRTWITKDKLFILNFDYLTIYDLNFFNANTLFKIPTEFAQYSKSSECNHCVDKLGISFEGVRAEKSNSSAQILITQVSKQSAGDSAGLLVGDQILAVNGINVNFPFHLQWYFLAFPEERNLVLTIKRANKTVEISLKI